MRVVEFYFYLLISLLPLLGLAGAGQEAIQLVNLHEPNPFSLHFSPRTTSPLPIAVSVTEAELSIVSSSVLAAESWLKTHVFAHLPSTRITTIVVGKGVLCNRNHKHQWSLVLPSVKNLYYCLVRRGLVEKIKVSAAFSSDCFHYPLFSISGGDLKQDIVKPLLGFLQDNTLVYSIDSSFDFSHLPENVERIYSIHRVALEELGFSKIRNLRLLKKSKQTSRKLPSPYILPSPIPLPPTPYAPVPDSYFSFVPSAAPSEIPTNPPDAPEVPPPLPKASPSKAPASAPLMFAFPPPLPPRAPAPKAAARPPYAHLTPPPPNAPPTPVPTIPRLPPLFPPLAPCSVPAPKPAPGTGKEHKGGLWCVAKPTVPAEKLQEAMDYACGEGGADCKEIKPNGSCYYPDTVVAHASYAFNSYWQKAKHIGGSCNFDGTAILITSDPSFQQCRFVLN